MVDQVQALATQQLPDTISTQFQGAAKAFQSSLGNLTPTEFARMRQEQRTSEAANL